MQNKEFSVEHISGATVFMCCGNDGMVVVPDSIDVKAPPSTSPNATRLVLATTTRSGGIHVGKPDRKTHKVVLSIDPKSNEKSLLIRIPLGVRMFTVRVRGGLFFYYEAAENHSVDPLHLKKADTDTRQMQELILAVSPIPPPGPADAPGSLTFNELTVDEVNARRKQVGLQALS